MVLTFMGNYSETAESATSLSWTAGELFVKTLETNNYILTQGFQQNTLTITATRQPRLPLEVKVFPNPAHNRLIAEFSRPMPSRLQLFNLQGILLLKKRSTEKQVTLELGHLPAGAYLLRITNDDHKEQHFKITVIH